MDDCLHPVVDICGRLTLHNSCLCKGWWEGVCGGTVKEQSRKCLSKGRTTLKHKSPSHVDEWMGKVKLYKKLFAPNCLLYLKNSIFNSSAKICTLSKAPLSLTAQKTKWKLYILICPGTSSIPVFRQKQRVDLTNINAMLAYYSAKWEKKSFM